MIIDFSTTQYQPGSNKGRQPSFEQEGILNALNLIIEWGDINLSPEKKECPILVPGDVFLFDGQVIAVESDKELILLVSETGPLSLKRIWNDVIYPELCLISSSPLGGEPDVKWETVNDIGSEATEKYNPDFGLYKVFKNKFITGRGFVKDWVVKVTYKNIDAWIVNENNLYLTNSGIWYNPNDTPEDLIKEISTQALREIYIDIERIIEKKKEEEEPLSEEEGEQP